MIQPNERLIDGAFENSQPELFPPFVEFAPAYQVAPPVAVEREIER
jgi:hypothetical protein